MDFSAKHSTIKTALEADGYTYVTLETWREKINNPQSKIPASWDNKAFTILPPDGEDLAEDYSHGQFLFGVEFVLKTVNDKYLSGLESVRDNINSASNSYMVNLFNTEEVRDNYILYSFPGAFRYFGA